MKKNKESRERNDATASSPCFPKKVIQKVRGIKKEVFTLDKSSLPQSMLVRLNLNDVKNAKKPYNMISLALVLALRALNINDLDVTIRERESTLEVIVEK